jgi:predicted GIY-YIG superfamily endonuclease
VPRSLLQDFLKMPESNQVAFYFLFGEQEDDSEKKVYIGQTSDLQARLTSHNKNKDFWHTVLLVISRTHSLTQTHALFLEWYCLQATRKAKRYLDDNGNSGTRPHTPAPLEADCLEIFDTAKTLLATLGYPIFDPIAKPTSSTGKDEVFYCKGSGSDGRGLYTSEGFVVLSGSIGRKDNAPAAAGSYVERFRQKLQVTGVYSVMGDKVVFNKDHLFGSPSMAAIALMGRSANGWTEWKSADGQTLDELKRQTENAS